MTNVGRMMQEGWTCPRCCTVTGATNGRTCPKCGYNGDWIQPGEAHLYSCATRSNTNSKCDCLELSKNGGRRVY